MLVDVLHRIATGDPAGALPGTPRTAARQCGDQASKEVVLRHGGDTLPTTGLAPSGSSVITASSASVQSPPTATATPRRSVPGPGHWPPPGSPPSAGRSRHTAGVCRRTCPERMPCRQGSDRDIGLRQSGRDGRERPRDPVDEVIDRRQARVRSGTTDQGHAGTRCACGAVPSPRRGFEIVLCGRRAEPDDPGSGGEIPGGLGKVVTRLDARRDDAQVAGKRRSVFGEVIVAHHHWHRRHPPFVPTSGRSASLAGSVIGRRRWRRRRHTPRSAR